MTNTLDKVKFYVKGFTDAVLISSVVVMGIAYADQKEKNENLMDRVEEQESLIQRFGWPKTSSEAKNIPKGKRVSNQQPTNPIGFH